jgi:crotonobetainyl-CoA:carnitine CoA-transferase CaiB-like acyl-CoA transferase
VIAVGNDAQFARLLGVLGLADPDGRYATNPMRVVERPTLRDWLGERIALRDRDELVEALARADVPAGPVNSVPEAVAAMGDGWAQRIDGMTLAPSPIRVDGTASIQRRPPPRVGEHTDAVLAELD